MKLLLDTCVWGGAVKELIAARQAAGMNASQLAAEIDLKPSAVSKIERGTQGLTVRNIKAYARVTGLSKAKTEELLLLAANDDSYDDWLVDRQQRDLSYLGLPLVAAAARGLT